MAAERKAEKVKSDPMEPVMPKGSGLHPKDTQKLLKVSEEER